MNQKLLGKRVHISNAVKFWKNLFYLWVTLHGSELFPSSVWYKDSGIVIEWNEPSCYSAELAHIIIKESRTSPAMTMYDFSISHTSGIHTSPEEATHPKTCMEKSEEAQIPGE